MNIIANLNPFEAVVSGGTMIVQFPSDYKTYLVDGVKFPSTYNKQIAMSIDSVVLEYTPPVKTLVKIIATDGTEYTPDERNAEFNKFKDEDGEDVYPDLEVEFLHRKLLQMISNGEKIYEETPSKETPVNIKVVGEYTDTGSPFILTPLVFGKARFYTGETSFYKLDVTGVIGDTLKVFAQEHNYTFENSTHSGYEYAKIDGKYAIPNRLKDDARSSQRMFATLKQAKDAEKVTREGILCHLRGMFNTNTLDKVTVKQMHSEVSSMYELLVGLDVKQKSFNVKQTLKTKLLNTLKQLGEQ